MENNDSVLLLVTYTLQNSANSTIYERTVAVSRTLEPASIVPTVKQLIRPLKEADPSDNYRGQHPSQIDIVNLINLSTLL
ncbi:hypothetical protein [Marinobacter salarius]|uniref:Uncharacterized protein n=1 Tax=Marinobacter salarius TaxID=1420917 RepID=A0A1W6KFS4_9GAMM|nr:hypothetical protein [Marinobacter salarius]ARM86179.1 hypothetical protein MARSALSMR5_04159 [Marinobacter salarius]